MSTQAAERPTATVGSRWGAGRSGLVMAGVMAAFATYLVVGVMVIRVPEGTDPPGPGLFPLLVGIAGYVVAVLLAISAVRQPDPPSPVTYAEHDDVSEEDRRRADDAAAVPYRTFSDWRSVAWAVGGFLAFGVLLEPAGWLVSAALLFWCVARAMGSRRPLLDLSVAVLISSVVYLAFDVALGLNLPSGIVGGW